MDDVVLFDLPSHQDALRLRTELGPRRVCLVEFGDEVWSVRATFGPEPDDLARLLRTAERWVADWELYAIRLRLDGRAYVLAAGAARLESCSPESGSFARPHPR